MQVRGSSEVVDAQEAVLGVFEGDAADHAVDFVAFLEQELGEIRAVLAGDAGDECFLHQRVLLVWPGSAGLCV